MAYVYLIKDTATGAVKIGISGDVGKRLASLQTASPNKLILLHVISVEDARALELDLHAVYASKRRSGEWFDLGDDEIAQIMAIRSSYIHAERVHKRKAKRVIFKPKNAPPDDDKGWRWLSLGKCKKTGRIRMREAWGSGSNRVWRGPYKFLDELDSSVAERNRLYAQTMPHLASLAKPVAAPSAAEQG